MMAEITVIIPIYQVEAYIAQCLDSLVQETMFDRCQVLLIDDGSKDRGPEIAQKYAESYDNCSLLRFPNGGLSEARNRGLDRALGKYVFFLDSDDLLSGQYLERLYETAEETGCDIVYAGFSETDEAGNITCVKHRSVLNRDGICTGSEFLERRMDAGDWNNQVWCALYRREFLETTGLRFLPECRLYEDVLFSCQTAAEAKRVTAIPEYGYLYRSRPQSLVHCEYSQRDIEGCIQVLEQLLTVHKTLEGPQKRAYGRAIVEHMSMTAYHLGAARMTGKKPWYQKLRKHAALALKRGCAVTPKERVKAVLLALVPEAYYRMTHK